MTAFIISVEISCFIETACSGLFFCYSCSCFPKKNYILPMKFLELLNFIYYHKIHNIAYLYTLNKFSSTIHHSITTQKLIFISRWNCLCDALLKHQMASVVLLKHSQKSTWKKKNNNRMNKKIPTMIKHRSWSQHLNNTF